MGFESLLKDQVQGLMKTLGQNDGLAPAHSYVQVTEGAYDTVTRTRTPTESVFTGIPMVLARFSVEEMQDPLLQVTDLKALIAFNDLPTGVTPKEQDKIRLTSGEEYDVVKLMGVPGNSIYILQIRLIR
jgi:hypothetical protein